MAEQHTFPQSGDEDDAENFAQMIGHANLVDFVIDGMTFTVDYGVPDVTIATGVCSIGQDSDTAASTSETRLKTGTIVQLPQATKSLTDSDVNFIYVEPNLGTDDNATFQVYTNEANASSNALKLGEIDTTNDTSTLFNREPSGSFASTFLVEDASDASTTLIQLTGSGPLELTNVDLDMSGNDISNLGSVSISSGSGPIDLPDDSDLQFGDAPDFSARYDSGKDTLVIQDETTTSDVAEVDKSGNLNIAGTLTESTTI